MVTLTSVVSVTSLLTLMSVLTPTCDLTLTIAVTLVSVVTLMSVVTLKSVVSRGVHAYSCIMGNQGKMWEIRRFVLEFKAPYFFLNSYI